MSSSTARRPSASSFLNTSSALQFRGCVSNNAIAWAQADALWKEDNDHHRWPREFAAAALYYDVVHAAEQLWSTDTPQVQTQKLYNLDIENPLDDDFVVGLSGKL